MAFFDVRVFNLGCPNQCRCELCSNKDVIRAGEIAASAVCQGLQEAVAKEHSVNGILNFL